MASRHGGLEANVLTGGSGYLTEVLFLLITHESWPVHQ